MEVESDCNCTHEHGKLTTSDDEDLQGVLMRLPEAPVQAGKQ